MPIYPVICEACQQHAEVFAKSSERDAIVCPACGGATRRNWQAMKIKDGNPEWAAREKRSLFRGCHPDEVGDYRRLIASAGGKRGADVADCIKDDGSVVFDNTKQQREFDRRDATLNPPPKPRSKPRPRSERRALQKRHP